MSSLPDPPRLKARRFERESGHGRLDYSSIVWIAGSLAHPERARALSHVIGDMLGSPAALIAGGVILLTGWMSADPILSAVVALLMVRSGWRVARESAYILLEGAPANFDAARVAAFGRVRRDRCSSSSQHRMLHI